MQIIRLQAEVAFDNKENPNGELAQVCMYMNEDSIRRFEDVLILATTILEGDEEERRVLVSFMNGVQAYKRELEIELKREESRKEKPPSEILPNFIALPDEESRLAIAFEPINDVVTEAFLMSRNEILILEHSLRTAYNEGSEEQKEAISGLLNSIEAFLLYWKSKREQKVLLK